MVSESMMENETYAPLYMEYLSCHVAYPFWLTSFYLFIIFWAVICTFVAYLIFWKRGARWRVVQGTSAVAVG